MCVCVCVALNSFRIERIQILALSNWFSSKIYHFSGICVSFLPIMIASVESGKGRKQIVSENGLLRKNGGYYTYEENVKNQKSTHSRCLFSHMKNAFRHRDDCILI